MFWFPVVTPVFVGIIIYAFSTFVFRTNSGFYVQNKNNLEFGKFDETLYDNQKTLMESIEKLRKNLESNIKRLEISTERSFKKQEQELSKKKGGYSQVRVIREQVVRKEPDETKKTEK